MYIDENHMEKINNLSRIIIDCVYTVHREIGPGLLESAYEKSLCREFELRKIRYKEQVNVPLNYKGIKIDSCYKLDILVEDEIILELKSVEEIKPIHISQLITYLKLYERKIGFIVNFNVHNISKGIKRIAY